VSFTRGLVELDHCHTQMGELTLRRRGDLVTQRDVYEVRLGEEYLMSSMFTRAEEELSRLALADAPDRGLQVLVGGLGLGYTGAAALEDVRVRRVVVVDALEPVIRWHRQGLLPTSALLVDDPRVRLVEDDFFALVAAGSITDLVDSGTPFDVVVVDIDHTPDHLLHASHGGFYTEAGLRRLRDQMSADGVFGLWSDGSPRPEFLSVLGQVFDQAEAHVVSFPNPYTQGTSSSTVYTGRRHPHHQAPTWSSGGR
jgi:spermidine synthase